MTNKVQPLMSHLDRAKLEICVEIAKMSNTARLGSTNEDLSTEGVSRLLNFGIGRYLRVGLETCKDRKRNAELNEWTVNFFFKEFLRSFKYYEMVTEMFKAARFRA